MEENNMTFTQIIEDAITQGSNELLDISDPRDAHKLAELIEKEVVDYVINVILKR